MVTADENLFGLMAVNHELTAQAEYSDDSERVVLDMDSTESPMHDQQEGSAYNGHYESVCYHPLLLFNQHGDCLAAKLRPGNVSSAEGWDELLLPEIERQQAEGKRVTFRADAAFAKPEIYEALEERGLSYVIRIPATRTWSWRSKTSCSGRRDGPRSNRWCATRASVSGRELVEASSDRRQGRAPCRRAVSSRRFHRYEHGPAEPLAGALLQQARHGGAVDQGRQAGDESENWARPSCHRFRSNEVRLQLAVMAYNLGNLWRRLGLPSRIKSWSLTSLQHRLMKTGGRLVRHARYYWLLLAEGHLNRRLFGEMLNRLAALPAPGG